MICQWRQCGGKIWHYPDDLYPYRCLSCGRTPDLEWEEKKALLQAIASEKQRWNYGAGQDIDVYRQRARRKNETYRP